MCNASESERERERERERELVIYSLKVCWRKMSEREYENATR